MFSSSSQAFLDFGKYIGGCLRGLKSFFRKEFLRFKADKKIPPRLTERFFLRENFLCAPRGEGVGRANQSAFTHPAVIAALRTILIALVRILSTGAVSAFVALVESGVSDIGVGDRGHDESRKESRKNSDGNACQLFQDNYLPKNIVETILKNNSTKNFRGGVPRGQFGKNFLRARKIEPPAR